MKSFARRPILAALALGIVGLTGSLSPAGADVPAPTGRVLLEVSGTIRADATGKATFDRSALASLGEVELRTTTPWTEGETAFKGVPLRRLLEHVQAEGHEARAIALNDYEATLLLDNDAFDLAVLAYEADGKPMRVRDKGPIWIVFPWSQHPELDNELVRNWAVWQLNRLVIQAP